MQKFEVVYPLDVIQFVSGNKKMYLFIEFLFERASEFNKKMKVQEGENYFPFASYNSRAHAYDFEFEFLIESYVEYAKEYYDIDEDSQSNMYQYLYYLNDKKIYKSRYIFFVNILGSYFSLGSGFYSDCCKNKGMIYYDMFVANKFNIIANSRVIQVRDFMEQHLKPASYEEIKKEKLEQVAYGKTKMEAYLKEMKTDSIPKIYDLS
ncbi:MAG: hypothetical protein COA39_012360 [Sulfurimonas sp.]|nr:hypothetical protein [Sulfurimonas sp.]